MTNTPEQPAPADTPASARAPESYAAIARTGYQDRISAAETGTRYATALDVLADAYGDLRNDGTTRRRGDVYVSGDGFYSPSHAAHLLTGIGYDPDQVQDALTARLDPDGWLDVAAFASALGELTGEPDTTGTDLHDVDEDSL